MSAQVEVSEPQSVTAQAPAVLSLATMVDATQTSQTPPVLGLKMAISRHDVVTIAALPGKEILISFEDLTQTPIEYTDIPQADMAMIFRAVDALRRELGRSRAISGVDITIQKNIPFETHLGGQGAAAAAVLVALTKLWGADFSREALLRIAKHVGPEVAESIAGGAMISHETADDHQHTQILVHASLAVVLVPAAADLTATEIFATVESLRRAHPDESREHFAFDPGLVQAVAQGDAAQVALLMHNDFQSALVDLLPEHHEWLTTAMDEGALAAQTVDRGPSLVFIARDTPDAQALATRFAERTEISAVAEYGPVAGAQLMS